MSNAEPSGTAADPADEAGPLPDRARPDTRTTADHERHPATDVLLAVGRNRWMCAAIVAICVVVALDVGLLLSPQPSATATIALKTPGQDDVLAPGASDDGSLARYTSQRAQFATSDAVLGPVATAVDLADASTVREQVDVEASPDSNVLTVTATAESADLAVQLANEVTRSYRAGTRAQVAALTKSALASIDATEAQVRVATSADGATTDASASTLAQLQLRASALRTDSALLGDGVDFVVAPRDDAVLEPGLPVREMAFGLVLGLALAVGAAWLRSEAAASSAAQRTTLPARVAMVRRALAAGTIALGLAVGAALLPTTGPQQIRAVDGSERADAAPSGRGAERRPAAGPAPTVADATTVPGAVPDVGAAVALPLRPARLNLLKPGWVAAVLRLPLATGPGRAPLGPAGTLERAADGIGTGPSLPALPPSAPTTAPPTTRPPTTEPPTTAPPATDPPPTDPPVTDPPPTDPPVTDPPTTLPPDPGGDPLAGG
jgi:capsular polysaccharide biosynthesis protein